MERRNVELEVEAMTLLANKKAEVERLRALAEKSEVEYIDESEEKELLTIAMQISIQESEIEEKLQKKEEAELAQAIAMSLLIQEEAKCKEEEVTQHSEQQPKKPGNSLENLQEGTMKFVESSAQGHQMLEKNSKQEKEKQNNLLQKMIAEKQIANEKKISINDDLRKKEMQKLEELQKKKNELPTLKVSIQSKQQVPANIPTPSLPSTMNDKKERLEAMKLQKELLIQSKKQERERDLRQYQVNTTKKIDTTCSDNIVTKEERKKQEMRNALAKRLKEDLLNMQTKDTNKDGAVLSMAEQLIMAEMQRKEKLDEMERQRKAELNNMFSNAAKHDANDEFTFAESK